MVERRDITVLLVVAGALFDGEGRVLVQRRPAEKQHGGLWEFPGGKVEPGETATAALVRELSEELSIVVDPNDASPAGFATGASGLVLLLFRLDRWGGDPRPGDAEALEWVPPADLRDYPMPPADRALAAAL